MSVTAGEALDEAHLYTNAGLMASNDSYTTGNTSASRQVVIVSPCVSLKITNAFQADNQMYLYIYRADITAGGGLSDWTVVVNKKDMNDEDLTYAGGIDKITVGADYQLTSSAYAIAWKIVTDPHQGTLDGRCRAKTYWGKGGLQKSTNYLGSGSFDSLYDWATYYQGHEMLILKDGFREAYRGSLKSDAPENYVTFLQDTQITTGHTIVFAP